MKAKNIFAALFVAVASVVLVGCNRGHELVSPHTDASKSIVGTYQGVMTLDGDEITNDVVIEVAHIDNDSVQAVTVNFKSAAKNMDESFTCNVAQAGERVVLLPAAKSSEASRNTSAEVKNDVITLTSTLNSKFKISAGSSAKRYTMVCAKAVAK